MDELNEKLNKYFAGKVVRKDLTKKLSELILRGERLS